MQRDSPAQERTSPLSLLPSEETMRSHTHYLWFNTKSRQEIIDITDQVAE